MKSQMSRSTIAIAALAAAVLAHSTAPPASAQEGQSQTWSEMKCARYKQAWSEALARRGGTQGLSQEFIDRHGAFVASGCTARADVCPRSAEELDLANVMVISAMNAGTASTFLPFSCRK
jgi:hypothetical protein